MIDLLANSVPIDTVYESRDLFSLDEAVHLWYNEGRAVMCVQGLPAKCNLDYAFYRHGEELWCSRPEEPKWRRYPYSSATNTREMLLNWDPNSLWRIVLPPEGLPSNAP